MLTKHVLYQLSYISIERCKKCLLALNEIYYSRFEGKCQGVFHNFFVFFAPFFAALLLRLFFLAVLA